MPTRKKARTRVERDTLGEVEVPARARYGAQTARAVQNFPISGLRAHPAFLDATLRVKLAAARVNGGLGLLSRAKARAIERAAREVLSGADRDQFVVDVYQAGAGTSHNMNVNEVLAHRANELLGDPEGAARVHPNDDVNMGQSTNDVVPTAIRLAALELAPDAIEALSTLAATFASKAAAWDRIVKAGRTHLMDATPIRLGQEVSGWATALGMAAGRVRDALPELSLVGIGGTAVGTGLNAHPRYAAMMVEELAHLTGTPLQLAPNPFYAMQSLAPFVTLAGALRVAALELLRIGGDIRLLGSGPSTGLGELELPAVQPGSSIMPGKVNPSMAEMLAMVVLPGRRAGRRDRLGHQRRAARAERDDAAGRLRPLPRAGDPRPRRARLRPAPGAGSPGQRSAVPCVCGADCEPRHGARAPDRLRRRGGGGEGLPGNRQANRRARGRTGRAVGNRGAPPPRPGAVDAAGEGVSSGLLGSRGGLPRVRARARARSRG